MKISIICKTDEWQVEQLKKAAPKHGVDIDVLDITEPGEIPENLGEIVLWRSSSLGGGAARFDMMNMILKKHTLINRCLAHLPQSTEKAFQQRHIQTTTPSIHCIPTFTFQSVQEIEAAIQDGRLHYPFIQKPNKGSKGEGVELVQNITDLRRVAQDVNRQVYQNFIQNSGDYRAFILGGRMLGAIRRSAQDGGFLNNISKGGKAEVITDLEVLSQLRRIGTAVASAFELTICGVDIIYNEMTHQYLFLEVNTVPQWKGFQEATGINVADEIIQYCKRFINRKNQPTLDLVLEEYRSQLHILTNKQFHFLSRMYLWTRTPTFKEDLDGLRGKYIGNSTEDTRKLLGEAYTRIPKHGDRMIAKEARQLYFKKYPNLEPSLNLLFKNLFAQKIYETDIQKYIRDLVSDAELLRLKSAIENDPETMRILSTHAINYLYMLDAYLETEESRTNPERYFEIGISYAEESFDLQIYFFTHCIIGASKFYSTEIEKNVLPIYIRMLSYTEDIIRKHFKAISLDNKFEFLVCAKICGYISTLEKDILLEADYSLSPDGNFLIDTHNETASPNERNDFVGAEHRNVLYIMSQTPLYRQTT